MPKVHGTGSPNTRPAGEAAGAAAGRDLSSSITLLEIQQDRLTKIEAASWLKTAGAGASAWKFDPELVREIYEAELLVSVGRKTVSLQRVMILEVSQCLENYVCPNFDSETPTLEHVMSMIIMVNEKGRALSVVDKRNYLLSMINAFQPTLQLLLQRHDKLASNFDKSTPYTECLVGDTGRIHFIGGILECLVNFKIYQLCQAQMMSHDAAYQK